MEAIPCGFFILQVQTGEAEKNGGGKPTGEVLSTYGQYDRLHGKSTSTPGKLLGLREAAKIAGCKVKALFLNKSNK